MVVVRESPRQRPSPDKAQIQWPPKSPFQALLSSPNGRKRWQDIKDRTTSRSPSPSPTKRSIHGSRTVQTISANEDDNGDEGEDEEALKLKLEILQTELKLKELRNKKKAGSSSNQVDSHQSSFSTTHAPTPSSPRKRSELTTKRLEAWPSIEVPLSPQKNSKSLAEPASPFRARLGLDGTARARDISLKRPRDATQTKTSKPEQVAAKSSDSSIGQRSATSFSQRLADAQRAQQDKHAKDERIERSRSKRFDLPREGKQASHAITREKQSTTTNGLRRSTQITNRAASPSKRSQSKPSESVSDDHGGSQEAIKDAEDCEPSFYDPFSELHLSKRHIAHPEVARCLDESEIYTIPRLLKEVKSPDYDPPDCESDFVVFGILASKTSPFDQKPTHRVHVDQEAEDNTKPPKQKFMVLKLCDLKWEIDCFLFGSGFDQFWKLTEGTLLAILNPGILPPKVNQNNGRFSLKLASCEDRVLEIGLARDLGYCSALKKDGQPCNAWVDKRKTEVCEFHVNLQIEKNRKGRMEVNTMWRGHGDKDGARRFQPKQKKNGPVTVDREFGQLYTVNTGLGRSAATLLDDEDTDALHNMTQGEASRKRVAAAQRERELVRKLGGIKHGVAGDYFRAEERASSKSTTSSLRGKSTHSDADNEFSKPTAADLGLLGKSASEQRLSPAKDRKRHFGLGAVSSAGTEALGWGGARRSGLLDRRETRLRSPEKGQTRLEANPKRGAIRARSQDGSLSPKKRARFALSKGIREPGRESLGDDLKTTQTMKITADDDEDDLDIV